MGFPFLWRPELVGQTLHLKKLKHDPDNKRHRNRNQLASYAAGPDANTRTAYAQSAVGREDLDYTLFLTIPFGAPVFADQGQQFVDQGQIVHAHVRT